MKTKLAVPALVVAIGATAFLAFFVRSGRAAKAAAREVYDGFERKEISPVWRVDKLTEGAVVLQETVVRSGTGALQLTIRPQDHFSASNSPGNRGVGNERDELQEANEFQTHEGEGWAYSFSLHLPKDFPIVPTRLVLAQWKHRNDRDTAVRDNPILALRYEGGVLSVSTQTGEKKFVRFRTKDDPRGRWVDFVFHVRFSRKEDGLVRGWMDGKEIISFRGQTAYDEAQGYPKDSDTFYFKMGLYRDAMSDPMTVYLDEYRKRPLSPKELE
jgi:peptide/nickel transport system ATP-binding protein